MGFNCLIAAEPPQADSLLLPISPQDFLLLIWLTSEEWKAKSTLEPRSDSEQWILRIQNSNY